MPCSYRDIIQNVNLGVIRRKSPLSILKFMDLGVQRGHSDEYQPLYQAGYQPSGSHTGPALRLIPSLILRLILDLVSPFQLVLYVYSKLGILKRKRDIQPLKHHLNGAAIALYLLSKQSHLMPPSYFKHQHRCIICRFLRCSCLMCSNGSWSSQV